MEIPFDYVDITPKRVDVLFDMDLIEYNKGFGDWGIYRLSDLGKQELKKYKDYREKKRRKIADDPNDKRSDATTSDSTTGEDKIN